MTAPATLFRAFSRLVRITILDRSVEVPENNVLLRCLQYLAPEEISYGRFCWNEDCQYCRVTFDLGEGGLPIAPHWPANCQSWMACAC